MSRRPSRIDKSFYLDSNLQDRKQKGRPQNLKNDQNVCSSQFTFGGPASYWKSKGDSSIQTHGTAHKSSATNTIASSSYRQTQTLDGVPQLDLNTSTDQEADLDCSFSERESNVSELSNDPYHRTLTPVTPIEQPKQAPNFGRQSNFTQSHYPRYIEPRPGSGTPRNNKKAVHDNPVPSTPPRINTTKTAWGERDRGVKFSSASPDIRICSGRGDSEYTDSSRSSAREGFSEKLARPYTLVAPYGTSTNSGYNTVQSASPTKMQCYKKRNQSSIFS